MKIIIAPTSVHNTIHRQLLQDNNTVFNVSVLTLSAFKDRFLNLPSHDIALKLQAIQIIGHMKHKLNVLSEALDFIDHQMSLFTFALECHQLGIPYTSLPQESAKEQDIYRICEACHPIFSRYDTIYSAIEKVKDLDIHIYLHPVSAIDMKIIQALFAVNAKQYALPVVSSEISIRSALNASLEAHAIAQYIASHPQRTTSVLCADIAQAPLLYHALKTYNVPFATTIPRFTSVVSALICALRYNQKPNLENFIAYCRQTHCEHHHKPSLLKYISWFNIPYDKLFLPLNHLTMANLTSNLFNREISVWRQLETEAEIARMHIVSTMSTWNCDSPLESIYTFFIQHPLNSYEDTQVLSEIKPLFEAIACSPLPHHLQIDLLIYHLNTKKCFIKNEPQLVTIHSLDEVFVSKSDQLIIMGATANHYPPTQKCSGLIDESYLSQVDKYPTLSQRNQALVRFEEYLFGQAPLTILSYPEATLDGKPLECSISLKRLIANPLVSIWKVSRRPSINNTKVLQLSPECSKKLFLANNTIKSSVSAIEQFFNCSFQYFFDKGLKLKQIKTGTLSSAHLGTMMHYIIETWVNASTPSLSEVFINDALASFKHDIFQCFPYHIASHDITFALLTQKMMLLHLQFAYFEDGTLFTPYSSELKFEHSINIDEIQLKLRGIIDRVDHYGDAFRIIDYKSSAKRIKEYMVLSGRQIQLFTYQMLYAAKTQRIPTGVHYYTLKNDFIDAPPQYLQNMRNARNTVLEKVNYDARNYFLEKAKINNSYINPESVQYYTKKNKLFSFKDDGTIRANNLYNGQKVNEALHTIFKTFVSRIKEGKIMKDPAEISVCNYCYYSSICNFNGNFVKKAPLFSEHIICSNDTLVEATED